MGRHNCKKCDNECEEVQQKKTIYPVKQSEIDISYYLRPLPKIRSELDSLTSQCTCEDGMKVPRYMCFACIRSWVNAVDKKTALDMANSMKQQSPIAANRILDAVEERRRRELFDANSNYNSDNGDSNIK